MALTLLHQDTFDRANGSLEGSTMSDGEGAWAVTDDAWDIVANLAVGTSGSGAGIFDDSQTPVGDQATEVVVNGADGGPACRHNGDATSSGATYYFAYCANTTEVYFYRRNAGGFTNLGFAGSFVVGDRVKIEAIGDQISIYVNDVLLDTITDATYATGVSGLYGGSAVTMNNFKSYVEVAATPVPVIVHHLRQQGIA